ncbi:type IV pilin protein [Paraherbaspirillum soli]|uniref:Type IV pilin protein n=1 Tax=Paraherbaspirillum soli TaxID=631222 RepID=A0ABW0M8J1_9BURK
MTYKIILRRQGFTLVELMLVVVIVAILSTVALPNYSAYVRRSERAAARAVLLEAAAWMERRFTVNNSYAGISRLPDDLRQAPRTGTAKYRVSLTQPAEIAAYQLQAAPERSGDKCGIFTLDHSGARGLIGNTASLEECWGR